MACGSSESRPGGDAGGEDGGGASAPDGGNATPDGGVIEPPGDGGMEPMEVNEGEYAVEAFDVELPDPGWHPLAESRLGLIRREEVAFLVGNEAEATWLEDDEAHGHAPASFAAPHPDAVPIWAEGGHLDDDGPAELVAIYYSNRQDDQTIRVTVSDDDDGSGPLGAVEVWEMGHMGIEAGAIDAALGDFDGDGLDEIAVVSSGDGVATWLRILEYVGGALVELGEPESMVGGRVDAKLAAGNFDDDPAEELAVLAIGPGTNAVTLVVRDDADADFAVIQDFATETLLPDTEPPEDWRSGGFVRAGNVDDDAQDELLVLLTHQSDAAPNVMTRVIDDVTGTPLDLSDSPGLSGSLFYAPGATEHPYEAVFADMNGDRIDELYIAQLDSRDDTLDWTLTQWIPSGDVGWNEVAERRTLGTEYNASSHARMAAVDGDELIGEGLIVALCEGGLSAPLEKVRIRADIETDAEDVAHGYALADFEVTASDDDAGGSTIPVVAGGDFDNDSLQVRYTGERWTSLAEPRPLAVLAAPPIKDGISQNVAFSETTFGTETTRQTSATEEVSTTYGVGLSFETSTLTGMLGTFGAAASLSFEKTLESQFGSSETQTRITTRGLSYGTSHPDDTVIFQGVLYTSYAYEVISASDPDVIGDRMTVDVPTGIKTYKWTMPYYNENIPDGAPRLGAQTFSHTPGDPSTYPTPAERMELLDRYAGWQSEQTTVGQGGNVNKAILTVASQTTNTSTSSITETDGWGIAIAGAGYDASRAVGSTSLFEVTFGTATIYEGVVGDIETRAEYEDYAYDFGLFVYNFDHPAGLRYQVVNYWTANLSPGYR